MVVVERMIQVIAPGKFEALNEIDKRYDVVEKKLGFPPKKRFWTLSGAFDGNTIIIERQWESMAKMEEVYDQAFANAEHQALNAEVSSIVSSSRVELYTPM
jgi:hypothetical protein